MCDSFYEINWTSSETIHEKRSLDDVGRQILMINQTSIESIMMSK